VLNLDGVGKAGTVTANVTSGLAGETITITNFGSYDTSIATVFPNSNTNSPYTTTVTAVAGGSTAVWGTATLSDNRTCTGSTTVNINGAWWQVKDGDVTTKEDLESNIPSSSFFELAGSGGYPGIPAYGGFANPQLLSRVSQNYNWIAKNSYSSPKVYNSSYFLSAIPAGTVIHSLSNPAPDLTALTSGGADPATGYYWNEYDASSYGTNLTISSLNIGTKKIILISKGAEVKLTGNINLTKGQGFFMLVAGKDATGNNGDIIVDPGVGGGGSANLEGIYISDGQFKTGTKDPADDLQLWVRGTIAAYGGMVLQRNLGSADATTPSELFEYAPDQEILFPEVFATHSTNWQEVAP